MINLATAITVARIFLVIPITYSILKENLWAAGICFVIACISDLLDGFIARRYNQVSALGALLDPLADKVIILGSFIATGYVYPGMIPWWMVVLLLVKEVILITAGAAWYTAGYPVIAARYSGKIAMIITAGYGILLFFTRYTEKELPLLPALCVALAHLYALGDYVRVGYRTLFPKS